MKKHFILIAVILLSFSAMAQTTTPEKKESKIELLINSKLGFAKLKQSGSVALNGNSNGAELLLSFKMGKKWDLASGLGYSEFDANSVIAGNTASIKNTYLQIPVKVVGDFTVFNKEPADSKIFLTIGAGLYANTLLKSEAETLSGNSSTKNQGWNFGISTQIGAKFLLSDVMSLGLGLDTQSDFTKMKKDGFEQRMEQINAFYLNLGLRF